MISRKRSSPRTGPKSYKRTKTTSLTPKSYVRRLPRPVAELKERSDSILFPSPLPGGGFALALTGGVELGDQGNQRNGKSVQHQDFDLRFEFIQPVNAQWGAVRVIVGAYNQAKTSSVVPTDIISGIGGGGGGAFNILRPYNYENAKNIVVLHDKIMEFHPTFGTVGNSNSVGKFLELKGLKYKRLQEYSGPSDSDWNDWCHFVMIINAQSSAMGVNCYASWRFIEV